MKIKRLLSCIVATCMIFSSSVAYAATATVLQGDTDNADDVEAFETHLEDKGYTVTYKGFRGNRTSSSTKATGSNLNTASTSGNDVIYWSSHGSSYPKLNVINGPSFNTLDYFNPTSSSPLQIAIFAACYQLDGNSNRVSFANKMRNSKVRIIAGYHEQAPADQDKNLVDHFFVDVKAGNSVRYSWETANVEVGKSDSWIVLAYKDGYNEYYRMPGFKNERNSEYPTPTSSTPIYRYWGLSNPAAEVKTVMPSGEKAFEYLSEGVPLKIEPISGERKVRADNIKYIMPDATITFLNNSQKITVREPKDTAISNSNESNNIVNELLSNQLGLGSVIDNSIMNEYLVMCAEIKEDGTDAPSEVIAKRITYNQSAYGIPVEGNIISVGVDHEGVYDIIDSWRDIQPASGLSESDYSRGPKYNYSDVLLSAEKYLKSEGRDINDIKESGLIYAKNDADGYELSYSIKYTNGLQIYVNLTDLSVSEPSSGR